MKDRSPIDGRSAMALYHGWLVVAAAFLIAMYGFGLGFYGPGIYLVALKALHGWSVAELSSAITAYYILGAMLLFLCVGPLFNRLGARIVVIVGALALVGGVVSLTMVSRSWQVYASFALMSLGWATVSGAAINIIVAPWFDARRGLALSWSMNGATAGGVVVIPMLTFLIARFSLATALDVIAGSMLAIVIPVAAIVLRPRRPDERDRADSVSSLAKPMPSTAPAPASAMRFGVAATLCSRHFIATSVPFALGLTAQVGFLTHQMAFLSPMIGTVAAGWAVSLTTSAAVLGRIGTGFVVDRFDRRAVACINFLVQALGMAVLATSTAPALLYLGCGIFGVGVGNATSLPGLIVQQEFSQQHFSRVVSLVVAINQFSFAFGPTLLGRLQEAAAGYGAGLLVCLAMEMIAAIIVSPAIGRSTSKRVGTQSNA